MRELMRQRSSASDYAGNTKGPETSSAVEQNKPTNSQSEPTDFSKMDSRINHSEPTNVVLTLKDETVALTAIATNPELSEANPIKLSDISVGLDEVTPHPGLEPVVLVRGRGACPQCSIPPPPTRAPGSGSMFFSSPIFQNCRLRRLTSRQPSPRGARFDSSKAQALFFPPRPHSPLLQTPIS